MDRRQKKTREAIFSAFTRLLEKTPYHRITVQDIIDEAYIGRSTFYAHFETKDYLLKDLCDELFGHITDSALGLHRNDYHYSCCSPTDSVFLHLLHHFQDNDRNIVALLSSQNNDIFLQYFKTDLKRLVQQQFADRENCSDTSLPRDYIINHISASFVETVRWWLNRGMKESPEEIAGYFEKVISVVM